MTDPELITIRQASEMSGKTTQHINRLIASGTLKFTIYKGKRKVELSQVKELWPDVPTEKPSTARDMIALKEGFQQALKKRDDKIEKLEAELWAVKDEISYLKEDFAKVLTYLQTQETQDD